MINIFCIVSAALQFLGDCDISSKIMNRRFSENLHEIAALCLNRDPCDRPTAGQLLTHPIFKTIRKSLPLTDLLKPAIPLSDKVAVNSGKSSYFSSQMSL